MIQSLRNRSNFKKFCLIICLAILAEFFQDTELVAGFTGKDRNRIIEESTLFLNAQLSEWTNSYFFHNAKFEIDVVDVEHREEYVGGIEVYQTTDIEVYIRYKNPQGIEKRKLLCTLNGDLIFNDADGDSEVAINEIIERVLFKHDGLMMMLHKNSHLQSKDFKLVKTFDYLSKSGMGLDTALSEIVVHPLAGESKSSALVRIAESYFYWLNLKLDQKLKNKKAKKSVIEFIAYADHLEPRYVKAFSDRIQQNLTFLLEVQFLFEKPKEMAFTDFVTFTYDELEKNDEFFQMKELVFSKMQKLVNSAATKNPLKLKVFGLSKLLREQTKSDNASNCNISFE